MHRVDPRIEFPIRIASGVWLVILTGILFRSGRARSWALLTAPSAALHFYLAYRLRHPRR